MILTSSSVLRFFHVSGFPSVLPAYINEKRETNDRAVSFSRNRFIFALCSFLPFPSYFVVVHSFIAESCDGLMLLKVFLWGM